MFYKKIIKRFLDLFLSIIGLILLFPVFILIIFSIKITSKGPVLFKQLRLGKDKKEFEILKFRTMKVDTPKEIPSFMLQNPEHYITKVGKFLRKSSLDELPQIINIIKGDMSIIGPRPVILSEYDLLIERDKNGVYNVTPGLTGWAQVNGRDEISITEKARLDGEYVSNISFYFDIKIFFLTIIKVLKSDGVREGIRPKNENGIENKEGITP